MQTYEMLPNQSINHITSQSATPNNKQTEAGRQIDRDNGSLTDRVSETFHC